jgi:hypothetical protein
VNARLKKLLAAENWPTAETPEFGPPAAIGAGHQKLSNFIENRRNLSISEDRSWPEFGS